MQKVIQEYLDVLGVSEKDLLNDLRGYYKPSFFYIYLKGGFDTDVDRLSIKDRGTFIHEYIHYIQNIATYWGLYTSIVRYHELTEFKSHLIASNNLEIPIVIDYSENLKRKIDRVKFGNGSFLFNDDRSWNINGDKEIAIEKRIINLHGNDSESIKLTISFEDGRVEQIDLGAHIIKESMAAMYQSLVDADAEHDDVPYNLIKILCNQHFSNICDDTEKLICICYTSLFSMSPGSELISLLARASAEPNMDGMSIFSEFVDTKTIVDKEGNGHNIETYFDILVNGFKKSLDTNLQADLDYIDKALERIRLSNRAVPYLTILYDPDKLSVDNINAIVGYFGIPYIQTLNNGYHFPQSTKEGAAKDESSVDVLELIAQETMFSYMTRPRRDKICPLYYMCSGSEYDKVGCIGAPWNEPLCSFTIVSSPFSLNEKTITWRF